MNNINSLTVLGTKVSTIDNQIAVEIISNQIIQQQSHFVCVAAVHLIMEAHQDDKFRALINNSLLTTPDGMPLVWLSHLHGYNQVKRVYGPDLMHALCELSQINNWNIFLVGGAKGQGNMLTKKLHTKYPHIKIVGHWDTPSKNISSRINNQLIEAINHSQANIVFVGLGCPLQEKWMALNYSKLNKGVCIGVGAAFDFISGKVKQAPIWMRQTGLEWLWRLFQDPKRLWFRYLILNSKFIFLLIVNTFRKPS